MTDHLIIKYLNASGIRNSALWIEEAHFGFRYVTEKISDLSSASRILEVGCGTGILLSMLSEEFPSHTFHGVEPLGDGFANSHEINLLSRELGAQIMAVTYEQLEVTEKYDLIFCVNSLEHVDDWRDLIRWSSINLQSGGLFFSLCPNYGFPYESHFNIPVIWNKKLTYRVFKKYIKRVERERNANGLWDTLNFIRKSEVKEFIRTEASSLNVTVYDDLNIIDDMVARVTTDAAFRKRQRVVGKLATMMKKLGVFGILRRMPNRVPYMSLTVAKND